MMLSKAELSKVAILNTSSACKPGMTQNEVIHYYNDWAKESKYDEQYPDDLYRGPAVAAAAVCYHLRGRTDASVLDVAAGTGKVGLQLKRWGFNMVDAIEPSEGMLEAAKQQDLYQNCFSVFFNNKVECIKSSQYDVLVCCGGLMDGHIPCDALTEMVRCVKKDGLIVLVMREEYLQTVAEYKDRLEPYMKRLETDGHWVLVDRTVIPEFTMIAHSSMEPHLEVATRAIGNATHVSTPGLTPEQVVNYYDSWSKDSKYDKELGDPYRGPAVAAAAVCYHLYGRTDAQVLDVAAGTGKVGFELKKHGLKQVDALEPSRGMLDVAKSNNIYRNYFHTYFTNSVPALQSNSYDVLVCCGGMMDGHLMCNVLPEMVRVVKSDGLIVLVMREEYLQTVAEYKDRLEPYMKRLETDGHWVLVDRTVIPEYFYHFNGIRFVFRVAAAMSGA